MLLLARMNFLFHSQAKVYILRDPIPMVTITLENLNSLRILQLTITRQSPYECIGFLTDSKEISIDYEIHQYLTKLVLTSTNNEEEYRILSKQQMHHSPKEYIEHDNPDSISSNIKHQYFRLNLTDKEWINMNLVV